MWRACPARAFVTAHRTSETRSRTPARRTPRHAACFLRPDRVCRTAWACIAAAFSWRRAELALDGGVSCTPSVGTNDTKLFDWSQSVHQVFIALATLSLACSQTS